MGSILAALIWGSICAWDFDGTLSVVGISREIPSVLGERSVDLSQCVCEEISRSPRCVERNPLEGSVGCCGEEFTPPQIELRGTLSSPVCE